MASESEHSGVCHTAGEDTAVRRTSIDHMPDEIMINIFSHLSFSELLDVVRKVCRRWRKLSRDSKLWADKEYHVGVSRHCNSKNCKSGRTEREAIRIFRSARSLRKVHIWRTVNCHLIEVLCNKCRRLTDLHLHAAQELSYSTVMDLVEQCSRIQTLRASDELLKTERASVAVSRLQHLRVLRLQETHVFNIRVVRPFVLRPLADGCPRLVEIDFGHLFVSMDDLKYFLNAKKNTLKSLRIKWSMDGTRNGGLQELKVLGLPYGCGVEDNTVIAISRGCPTLRQLSITHTTKLSPAAFSEIERLEHLEVLDVTGCKRLGGALFPHLVGLPRLHTLRVGAMYFGTTYVTGLQPGVVSILKLSGLRCLTLDYSTVTGMPFDKFPENLVSLRELSVEGCQGDPKATDRLTEQMPNLVIRGNIHARLQLFDFGAPEDNRVNADGHSESDEDSDSGSSVGSSDSERG
ncbi:F-box/LRR-repeat protein 7-like isoform X2 [Schistocerca cancellata]|uniref:F-box/LRR-repeat protein 7-like isoform X2 n=1 Tax=Schistocerca cancellata TaxID=274614 RepID=UPI002117EABA|nr:F-box/LRR-repeat protein 7-like isoform X2 [Schistocerca cancellata]